MKNIVRIVSALSLLLCFSVSSYSQEDPPSREDKARQWMEGFFRYKDFQATNHREPFASVPTEAGLAAWVNQQKTNKYGLSSQQQEMLDKLPYHRWDYIDAEWEMYYGEYEKNPSFFLNSPTKLDSAVGWWLVLQQLLYMQRQICDEKTYLMELVPDHIWELSLVDSRNLLGYYAEFMKDSRFDPTFDSKDIRERCMSVWLDVKRKIYAEGRMSTREVNSFNQIERHTWTRKGEQYFRSKFAGKGTDQQKLWEENYQRYKSFLAAKKRLPSKNARSSDEVDLASWLYAQRKLYKENELPDDKISLLEQVPGHSWMVRTGSKDSERNTSWQDNMWQMKFEKYKNFRIAEKSDPDESKLYAWLQTQRQKYRMGSLSQERIELLEGVPGHKWNTRTDKGLPADVKEKISENEPEQVDDRDVEEVLQQKTKDLQTTEADIRRRFQVFTGSLSKHNDYLADLTLEKLVTEVDANGSFSKQTLSFLAREGSMEFLSANTLYPVAAVLVRIRDVVGLREGTYDPDYYRKPEFRTLKAELRSLKAIFR